MNRTQDRTLPGAPFIARHDTRLRMEDVDLAALAEEYGTPLYVYSRSAMQSAAREYLSALEGMNHRLCYAVKANSQWAVLQTFAQMGLGFDIVSRGELHRALQAGARAQDIVFSGLGKTLDEVCEALCLGVGCFNVESQFELTLLSQASHITGKRVPISLRINPDVDAGTHPYISTGLKNNKFGIAYGEALPTYLSLAQKEEFQIVGVDCHIGSQILKIDPYIDALDRVLDLVETLQQQGIQLTHIDVGGGLGIDYGLGESVTSPGAWVGAIRHRLEQRGHAQLQLVMEPGRSLVGNAGVLLTRVLGLKKGETRGFCVVDAAMNDMLRPALYEAWMALEPCVTRSGPGAQNQAPVWDVVGPVCESGDWLARERHLDVQAGDVLALLSAGAYGMTMASQYNSRPRAAEVMVQGQTHHCVRSREQLTDLWAGEQPWPER